MKTDPKETRPKTKKIKNSSDYREVFLTNTQASNRSNVYIDREIVDCKALSTYNSPRYQHVGISQQHFQGSYPVSLE